jgi:DNA-binding transcriptional LysR family regulator
MPSIDQLHAVHNRELDVGIVRRPDVATPAGVRIEEWYRAPLVAAIPKTHTLAKRESLRIADLKDQPLILFPRDSGIGLYWLVIEMCDQRDEHVQNLLAELLAGRACARRPVQAAQAL